MFCDMVGSSALSTRLDPEEQRDVVSAFLSAHSSQVMLLSPAPSHQSTQFPMCSLASIPNSMLHALVASGIIQRSAGADTNHIAANLFDIARS
jgi:hypothetical protein